jgi:putative endonuclease
MCAEKQWSVYIVKCKDGKLYTGISNDVSKRVATHNRGQGCRFTKYRHPVKLVYQEYCGSKSTARKRELEIQGFTRSKKLALIESSGID